LTVEIQTFQTTELVPQVEPGERDALETKKEIHLGQIPLRPKDKLPTPAYIDRLALNLQVEEC